MSHYTWDLAIEIPAREEFTGLDPRRSTREIIDATSPTVIACSGTVSVAAEATPEQIREHIVNEVAKEYEGRTVTITRWQLTPVEVAR